MPDDSPIPSPFDAGKSQAVRAAEQLRSAASATVRQFRSAAEETAGRWRPAPGNSPLPTGDGTATADLPPHDPAEPWNQARERVRDLQTEVEDYVRAHPVKSILVTFGAGFVLGLLLRR
jgi:ElaB/YqjD/DUF883 family membrane-anchored ribosome-binding protein